MTPTPGEVAYAAFTAAHDPSLFWSTEGWDHLQRMTQQAWEAAAQAVRALKQEEDRR